MLLSPRILYFTAHELAWECKELAACGCATLQDTLITKGRQSRKASLPSWHDLVSLSTRL